MLIGGCFGAGVTVLDVRDRRGIAVLGVYRRRDDAVSVSCVLICWPAGVGVIVGWIRKDGSSRRRGRAVAWALLCRLNRFGPCAGQRCAGCWLCARRASSPPGM